MAAMSRFDFITRGEPSREPRAVYPWRPEWADRAIVTYDQVISRNIDLALCLRKLSADRELAIDDDAVECLVCGCSWRGEEAVDGLLGAPCNCGGAS